MNFSKKDGLGFDYVYVGCFQEQINNLHELSVRVSDRHKCIGFRKRLTLETLSAMKRLQLFLKNEKDHKECVDMGETLLFIIVRKHYYIINYSVKNK